jgi:hypothetical protein
LFRIILLISVLIIIMIVCGCGKKAPETAQYPTQGYGGPPGVYGPTPGGPPGTAPGAPATGAPAAGAPAGAAPTAAAGPASTKALKFSQLTLQSTIKRVKDKDGLVFLQFNYMDRDGTVYKCALPEAMAAGEYTQEEWVRTFNLYKLPDVVKQTKKTGPGEGQRIGGFPFISPKPQRRNPPPGAEAQKPAQKPVNVPQLPQMPSQSGGQPGVAPGGPAMPPGGPMMPMMPPGRR